MERPDIEEVSRPDSHDVGQAVVRAAVASVPVLGSAASELLNVVVTPPLEARRNEWLNRLADDVDELAAKVDGFTREGLSENDEFLAAVATAVGVATRAAQEEKRDMLRNAVLNSALGRVPEFSLQSAFIAYLDYLTPLHVRLLSIFRNPSTALKEAGSNLEASIAMGAPSQVARELLPDVDNETLAFVWQDLYQRQLVESDSLGGTMTKGGVVAKRSTKLGDAFLDFVSTPKELGTTA